jgi:hypothetical protein
MNNPVYMQDMVPSLSKSGRSGRLVHSSHSICVPIGHHNRSWRVTVPYAACIQYDLLKMNIYGSKHVEECNII